MKFGARVESIAEIYWDTVYCDGGKQIRIGDDAGYICPHGIYCPSVWDRDDWCDSCRDSIDNYCGC